MAFPRAQRDTYLARERFFASLGRLAVVLAGRRIRLLVFVIGLLLTAWQLFFFGWRPLQAETVLPAGLAGVAAQLDVVTLEKMQEARAARLQHVGSLLVDVDQSFAASPVAGANP